MIEQKVAALDSVTTTICFVIFSRKLNIPVPGTRPYGDCDDFN
jgi:hypothetical protein